MRRMDRYKDEDTVMEKRSQKNKDLYQNVVNTKITNINDISDVANSNAFEIQTNGGVAITSREKYHQMKKYQNIEPIPRVKKELEDFKYLYNNHEKKVYDINSVLEEARKNRTEKDELEAKRKLKNTSYNILADLNKEELEKYREEKRKRSLENHEVNELREIIDTITTKTLAGEIDHETSVNLLSDLMATNILDKVSNPEEMDKMQEEQKEVAELVSIEIEEVVEEPYIVSSIDVTEEQTEETTEEQVPEVEIKEETTDTQNEEDNLPKEQTIEMETVKELYENIEENLAASQNLFNKSEIKDALSKEEKNDTDDKNDTNIANEFETKDINITNEETEMSDDFKEKKIPVGVKILIFLLVAIIIAVTVYFIYLKLL